MSFPGDKTSGPRLELISTMKVKNKAMAYLAIISDSDPGSVQEARKSFYQLAAAAVALPIQAERLLIQAEADARAVGLDEKAQEAQKRARERRNDSVDRLAPAVYVTLPVLGQVEGVNLRDISDEDKEYLALGAANEIVAYWLRKPTPLNGTYTLNATFIRSHVRDSIRKFWRFGRQDRTKR